MEDTPKIGRPTTFKPEYCDQLIDHMGNGQSFESFGKKANCGKTTLYRWVEEHEEFRNAFTRAKAAHLDFMERMALGHMVEHFQGPKMNTALFNLFMVNIHGWKSKNEQAAEKSDSDNTFALKYERKKK